MRQKSATFYTLLFPACFVHSIIYSVNQSSFLFPTGTRSIPHGSIIHSRRIQSICMCGSTRFL